MPAAIGLAPAARCLALDALAARTSALFAAAEIPHLLIKGPVTARWLYPDCPDQRPYSDVDILVRPDRFDDAQKALASSGFRCDQDGFRAGEILWYEKKWRSGTANDLPVDLHRGLAGVARATAGFDLISASAESLRIAGTTIAVPGQIATAMILVLHAASPGRSDKPLVDLRRARERFDPRVWQEAADLARSCHAESSFRAGLGLLDDGEQLADRLSVGGSVRVSDWLAGRKRSHRSVAVALMLAKPGKLARLSHFWRKMLPSAAFMRRSYPYSGRGFPWLLAAYVSRLATGAWSMPRAFGDIRAARQALRTANSVAPAAMINRGTGGAAVKIDRHMLRSAFWTLRTREMVRRQLRRSGLSQISLPAPPSVRGQDRRVVVRLLRTCAASCLERSLMLQRFDASTGTSRALIIGVTALRTGFRAHAWLEGEPHIDPAFREIARHEIPAGWLAAPNATGTCSEEI